MFDNFLKPFICFSIFLFGFPFDGLAKPDHRLSLGLGVFSYAYKYEKSYETISFYNHHPMSIDELKSKPFTYNAHYECTLGRHFGVGVCLGYDYLRVDRSFVTPVGYYYSGEYNVTGSGEYKTYIFFVMPETTFYYFKRKIVAMYGKLAAGIRFDIEKGEADMYRPHMKVTESNKSRKFCMQVDPICLEVGGAYWRGFAECGLGAEGMGQLGIKYTFRKKGEND